MTTEAIQSIHYTLVHSTIVLLEEIQDLHSRGDLEIPEEDYKHLLYLCSIISEE